ncbi:MAG: type II 3-dehydroquinate dehydratase [Clostridia bacterium]|nr:type II 3-dehydroquinate dehydratase [Clostridia bacterium]
MKILVINGPNLNMLGCREPEIYGSKTYKDLRKRIKEFAKEKGVRVSFFQSNCEGDLVTAIQKAYKKYDGIVINPGAYTHTSIALLDAVKSVLVPTVEVHISDLSTREDFRQISYIRAACIGTISGKGFDGYNDAINLLISNRSDK